MIFITIRLNAYSIFSGFDADYDQLWAREEASKLLNVISYIFIAIGLMPDKYFYFSNIRENDIRYADYLRPFGDNLFRYICPPVITANWVGNDQFYVTAISVDHFQNNIRLFGFAPINFVNDAKWAMASLG